MAQLYLALSLPWAHCVLQHQHMAWGRGLAGSQVLGAEQRCRPTCWSRPHAHCPQTHTARAKAGRNILHKYLMAQDGLMLGETL